ncbi:MAG: hypothetical protein KA015_04540 [Spirochaetes bacterium]|nr:hypothetical protein [Spirochaetota bacterium]
MKKNIIFFDICGLFIIFGRLNYKKTASSFKSAKDFFNKMADLTIYFCDKNNIDYHVKEGTKSDFDRMK